MKRYKSIGVLFIVAISLTFCAMKQEFQTEFPQEIQSVFFQNGDDGAENNQTHFYIEFKKPITASIKLEKIYFHNQESPVEVITKNTFVSHFFQIKKEDLILDSNPANEYGNKAPRIQKSKFDLKSNEAVLQYKQENKTFFYKITNVMEKPLR
ncbi:hypothetical protein ACNQGP_04050 [Flavobacterium sp. GT2N3]|uniref:hypothetical protein n=1 Tax=unclassified Flavobacterium TaxID=196869 RepID=UPI003AB06021